MLLESNALRGPSDYSNGLARLADQVLRGQAVGGQQPVGDEGEAVFGIRFPEPIGGGKNEPPPIVIIQLADQRAGKFRRRRP